MAPAPNQPAPVPFESRPIKKLLLPFLPLDRQILELFRTNPSASRRIAEELNAIRRRCTPKELEETAIPSYTHPFAPFRYLFLKRLVAVADLVKAHTSPDHDPILDFGSGAGLMSLLLTLREKRRMVRYDIIQRYRIPLAAELSAEISPGATTELDAILGRVDACLALDVLEHLDPDTLRRFGRAFRKGTTLVVSGPTENALYKLSRRVAGFSGEYHQRNIYNIVSELATLGWREIGDRKVIFHRHLCPAFVIIALRMGSA